MFKPKFTYTSKIVNNLLQITSAREIIFNAYIIPKWEVSLRREALVRATHASTAIEGNKLTLEEVTQLAQGRTVMAAQKEKQEVLNYLTVLQNIENYQKKGIVSEPLVLKLHKDVTKETLEKQQYEGAYRKIQVYVGNKITGEVIFMPPKSAEVPKLVNNLLGWLNSEDAHELHPVLVAGITHYEFVRIHPFVDGNGRTARALATLILTLRNFDIKRFFALDDYYDSDRNAYYAALQSVDQKTLDITQWLEYFTDGVLLSISKVKERVLQLSMEKHKKDKKGQIVLTEHQMKIMEHIISDGRITSSDIQKMFHISRQAAHKELKKMIDVEIIEPKGTGRAIYYVVK